MRTHKKKATLLGAAPKSKEATSEGVTSKTRLIAHVINSIQHDEVSSKATFGASEVQV